MNRREHVKNLLDRKSTEFSEYVKFRDIRGQFFEVIAVFRSDVLEQLRNSKIVNPESIDALDTLLGELHSLK